MAIFDLTGRKYSSLITKHFKETVSKCLEDRMHRGLFHWPWKLEEIPVYLVEASQSQSLVSIPGSQYAVKVPKDQWEEMSEVSPQKSLSDLLRLRDLQEYWESDKIPEPKKGVRRVTVVDRLGVYLSNNDPIAPKRIFVWVDKICLCADGDVENASALLMQVILHELAHAFMDVSFMCDDCHNTVFTYSHPAYRFIEEAIANGLSLHMCMPILTAKQQLFIEQFVLNQGIGYSEGVPIYKSNSMNYVTWVGKDWRWSKSIFNKDIAGVIYKALLSVNLGSGLWLKSLGPGLREVNKKLFRAQSNNSSKG